MYFYDLTSQIIATQLNSKLLMEEKKNSKLSLSQMTMSHEFRAPLSSMLMILQRLLLGMIDAESRKLILVIISQLNLLVCLVNDILDHKLIEQGKFRQRLITFKPIDTLQFVVNMFKNQADLLNIDLSFHVVQGPLTEQSRLLVFTQDHQEATTKFPVELYGDQIRLQQILVNLVKNAVKFSCGLPIRILAAFDRKDKQLEVQVIDEGKGLLPDELTQLFQIFSQIERNESDNLEGIGMGLYICKSILDSCKGEIQVFSEGENKGTTFQFFMPMRAVNREQIVNPLQSYLLGEGGDTSQRQINQDVSLQIDVQ